MSHVGALALFLLAAFISYCTSVSELGNVTLCTDHPWFVYDVSSSKDATYSTSSSASPAFIKLVEPYKYFIIFVFHVF